MRPQTEIPRAINFSAMQCTRCGHEWEIDYYADGSETCPNCEAGSERVMVTEQGFKRSA